MRSLTAQSAISSIGLSLLITCYSPSLAQADDLGYAFVGITEANRFGGLRVGRDRWEVGGFPGGIGLGYRLNRLDLLYASVAPVLGLYAFYYPLGINTAVGIELPVGSFLSIRGEMSSTFFYNGVAATFVIIGAAVHL